EANAFVMALDVGRSWFRYHHLFADLLQLELRHTGLDQVTGLHQAAAGWLSGHGYPVEAIRHAQGAQDWGLAVRLLGDHWPGLQLGGQAATVHAILAGFPAEAAAADAELAALGAADEGAQGGLAPPALQATRAGSRPEAAAADAELAALAAADELAQGSLEAAERYLGVA